MDTKEIEIVEIGALSGNTGNKAPKKAKQGLQIVYYAWTLHYESEIEIENMKLLLAKYCRMAVFGEEVCPTTGSKHLQGAMKLIKRARITELKKLFGDRVRFGESHENLWESNWKYCCKGDQSHEEWDRDKWLGINYGLNAKVWKYGFPKLVELKPINWNEEGYKQVKEFMLNDELKCVDKGIKTISYTRKYLGSDMNFIKTMMREYKWTIIQSGDYAAHRILPVCKKLTKENCKGVILIDSSHTEDQKVNIRQGVSALTSGIYPGECDEREGIKVFYTSNSEG